MTIKERLLISLVTGVAAGSLYLGAPLYAQQAPASARVPVTITYRQTSGAVKAVSVTDAYRADGSMARTVSFDGSTEIPLTEVADVAAGRRFVVDHRIRQYDQYPFADSARARQIQVPASCEQAIQPSQTCAPDSGEQILGFAVRRAITSINNGAAQLELWLAPDLNYLPLKRVITEGGRVRSQVEAVRVQPGPPEEAQFTVPAGYTRAASATAFLNAGSAARGKNPAYSGADAARFDAKQDLKRE